MILVKKVKTCEVGQAKISNFTAFNVFKTIPTIHVRLILCFTINSMFFFISKKHWIVHLMLLNSKHIATIHGKLWYLSNRSVLSFHILLIKDREQ